MTTATVTELDIRQELARKDFLHFIPFVKILEPPPGRGIIPMEPWPHIIEAANALKTHRLIVWLKSRQVGASWLMAAYDLWTAMYQKGAEVALFSQGEDEAQDKLAKCRLIYTHLPSPLQVPIGADNLGVITFPSSGSRLKAYPSTPKAGRSGTGTLVDMDEADFHEHFEVNYNAVKPLLDDIGGQLVLTSTSNPDVLDSLFKRTYKAAPGNGFHPIFYNWRVRPNRDDAWFEARRSEYSDMFRFTKEYPESDQAALAPPEELRAFLTESLDRMMLDTRTPLETRGNIRIFQKFSPGRKYAAGTDTSHGTGYDNAVTVIIDVATCAIVADIMSNTLPPEQLAYESNTLLLEYGAPIWAIEDNDWGIVTVNKAVELNYPNLYRKSDDKLGWRTNIRTRPMLWGELIEIVDIGSLVIFNEEGLKQFYNVQKDPATGKIMSSLNDDYPMAVGLALQMRPHAFTSAGGGRMHRVRNRSYKW